MSIANAEILLAFKAGRAFRREGTDFVDPDPTKGAIYMTSDGELLHFLWKNRVTNEMEEDLILFPSDATFVPVPQASGRVYVLKFASSDQRHFFWLQDASPARDAEFVRNINGLLQDPNYDVEWNIPITTSPPPGFSATNLPRPSSSSQQQQRNAPAGLQATPEQVAQLRRMIAAMGRGSAPQPAEMSLIDILTPANLTPLFVNHPELVSALFPHLPPDLPIPPSAEALQRIVHSPQFRGAVSSFDRALRTGLLGRFITTLGLPEEAGTGVGPFLRAIQEKADREGNGMDTN